VGCRGPAGALECGSSLPLWSGRLAGRTREWAGSRPRASSLRKSGSKLPLWSGQLADRTRGWAGLRPRASSLRKSGSKLPLWSGRLAGRTREWAGSWPRASSLRKSGSKLPHSKAARRRAAIRRLTEPPLRCRNAGKINADPGYWRSSATYRGWRAPACRKADLPV
jgi:hypothetical protein